jgi:uncharacterized protein YlxW (UPF0749 family)
MPEQAPQGWQALRSALSLRPTAARLVAALLLGLLGFAVAVQVRSTQTEGLDTLRQSDLVRILDDTSTRATRLRAEADELERTREQLTGGTNSARAAIEDARTRARTLGILAGTVPAQGPGVVLTIADPRGALAADSLLDAIEELRDAGAEAIQVGPVRVVAQTAFTDPSDAGGGILVDGRKVTTPYEIVAIGDKQTLAAALEIPGGVTETLRQKGATPSIRPADRVEVSALRVPSSPQYARPAPAPGG